MALIKCKECLREYSDKADICPHCGYIRYNRAAQNTLARKRHQNHVINSVIMLCVKCGIGCVVFLLIGCVGFVLLMSLYGTAK